MKRSAYTYDIADGRKRPAKRAATSATKKAAASTKKAAASTKKASASKETSSNETAQAAAAAAASTSQPSDDAFGKRTKTPLGPKGELMIPQILPKECVKAIEKLLLPRGWVRTIDATPERSLSLTDRRWWEANGLWLESNKKALGLTAKQWKMKEEALSKGSPLREDDANTAEEFICIYPLEDEEDSNDADEDDEDDDDEARGSEKKDSSADKEAKKKEAEAKEEALCNRVGKLASRHPEHLWVSTLGGYQRFKWWTQEICKRNQDDYSLHVYNDFSWYGTIEVLENLVSCLGTTARS